METLEKLGRSGIVPVVVLERAESAVPTARALLAGGVGVMEITFRTAAAEAGIRAVSRECPHMVVGAGTVITPQQCEAALKAGARFIVSPGLDEEVVRLCVEQKAPIVPGCCTPTEIMRAMRCGLNVVKFFPANVYGGLSAMKSLSGPFGGIKFIPTGGIDGKNAGEYAAAPFVYAMGGSWICTKEDIAEGRFERITSLCLEARKSLLGFELAHVGLNANGADASFRVCKAFADAFGFELKEGNSSNFAGTAIEVTKGADQHGHVAIGTNRILCAIDELERRGFHVDEGTAKYRGEDMVAVYLKDEIGGFAVHLLQK